MTIGLADTGDRVAAKPGGELIDCPPTSGQGVASIESRVSIFSLWACEGLSGHPLSSGLFPLQGNEAAQYRMRWLTVLFLPCYSHEEAV